MNIFNPKPKVSIITVVFNNKTNLLKTVKAVRSQKYDNLEYIVIDGASTDGTLDVINSNKDIISCFISEKDNGIYDAMNKGLKASKGDYVWFINAGDIPAEDDILDKVFADVTDADLYYGDTEMIDENGHSYGNRTLKIPPKELNWKKMIDGMLVSHQSMIAKRLLCEEYDINYKFVADIDWAIKLLKKCTKVINTNLTLSKFLIGGYSRQYTIKSLKERFRMLCTHFNCFSVVINHIKLSFKFMVYIIKRRKLL